MAKLFWIKKQEGTPEKSLSHVHYMTRLLICLVTTMPLNGWVPTACTAAGFWPKAVNYYPIDPLLPGGSASDPILSAFSCPATVVDTYQAIAGLRQFARTTTAIITYYYHYVSAHQLWYCTQAKVYWKKLCPDIRYHWEFFQKHWENLKTLPTRHLIGCQGVKMFLLKDPF